MGLPTKRLVDCNDNIIIHLTCSICTEVLWKPVTCEECENSFCEECIYQWLQHQQHRDRNKMCPFNCQYKQRKRISPLLINLLSQLKFECTYAQNGCEEILSYEALEHHELNCDYQISQCDGCLQSMLKKYIIQHQIESPCQTIQCEQCKIKYRQQDKHDKAQCLENQIKNRNTIIKQLQQQQQMSSMLRPEIPVEHNHQVSRVTPPVDKFGIVYGILFIYVCFVNYLRGVVGIGLLLLDLLVSSWSIYNSTHVSRQNNVANLAVATFLGFLMLVTGIKAKTILPTLIIIILSTVQGIRMRPYLL